MMGLHTWKIGFLFFMLLPGFSAKGQDSVAEAAAIRELKAAYVPKEELPVYEMREVDIVPQYPGGDMGLIRYFNDVIKAPILKEGEYPPTSAEVDFVIETDGSVTEVKSRRPNLISDQLIEAARQMRRWKPAEKDGKLVRVRYYFPMRCIKWE